jgi:hypothetical protein
MSTTRLLIEIFVQKKYLLALHMFQNQLPRHAQEFEEDNYIEDIRIRLEKLIAMLDSNEAKLLLKERSFIKNLFISVQ